MAEGFLDKMKDKAEDLKDKAGDLVDKAKDELTELDDKAEAAAEKDGILGKVAGAAHKVIDKVDND